MSRQAQNENTIHIQDIYISYKLPLILILQELAIILQK